MQLKITVAVLFLLMVIVLIPVARADSIRAPHQPAFDVTGSLASSIGSASAPQSLTFHPDPHDPASMPEPGAMLPLLLLAAGAIVLRKRLVPIG